MTPTIHLGFEIGTAKPVEVPLSHIIVTGLTQLSGKTTTLEALITRSDLKAIVFRTKPGERGFSEGNRIAPYFKEKSDWQYVASLLEATLKEKLKFERSWIMNACKGTNSLLEVKRNIETQLANPKIGGLNRSVYTTLDEYFNLILPQMSVTTFSRVLEPQPGVNVMDLERLKDELQSLVIRSVLDTVLKEMHDTIVVMPEAWKFLPQERGNPCKQAAEEFIRQGGTNRNYLWIDSQDMSGVDKAPLKQVSTWILGLQSERNEVQHTLQQMPIPKKLRPTEDQVMTLQKGHFFACTPSMSKLVYVQPAWLDHATAEAVARGEKDVDELTKPLSASMPALPKPSATAALDEKLLTLEEVKKSIVDLRRDFNKQLDEVMSYVRKLAEVVSNQNIDRPAVKIDVEEIAQKVMQELPMKGRLVENIVDAVLARVPKMGATVQMTQSVEPVKALKSTFLQEAKEKILQQIAELSEDKKKVLKFVESVQRGVSQSDLLVRCLGLAAGSGSGNDKVREISKALHAAGFARREDKHATTHPNLRAKIKDELGFHEASDDEIEQVYNHIIAELL
jgi:uncharacterized protein YqgV (UPF0045/DUF77 family)